MKDERNIDFIWTLLESGFFVIISMIWYRGTLFRCLTNMTYTESNRILWAMLIVMSVIGAVVTCYGRKEWGISKTLLITYGLYTVFAYKETITIRIKILFWSSTIVAFVYVALIMFRKIKTKHNKRKIIIKRLHKCIYGYLSIITTGMAILMGSVAYPLITENSIFQSSIEATNISNEQTIENNINILLFLQEEKWEKLSIEKKLDVMQTVANIEAYYLGLPNELNVSVANLRENILGSYSDATHNIYISLPHLENDAVHEILNTCCHEAFHSYQYRFIDAYKSTDKNVKSLRLYKKAISYLQEFDNYIDGNKDFCRYYEQVCETDARNYASNAINKYYDKINEYLRTKISTSERDINIEKDSILYDENGYLILE